MTKKQIKLADNLLNAIKLHNGLMSADIPFYSDKSARQMKGKEFIDFAFVSQYLIHEMRAVAMIGESHFYLTPLGYYAQQVGFATFFEQVKHAQAIDFINKQESIKTARITRQQLMFSYFASIAAIAVALYTALNP